MSEVKDMYKVARFVDSDNYSPIEKELTSPLAAIKDCATQYMKKKWWQRLSFRKAHRLVDNALDHRYIEVVGDDKVGHFLRVSSGRGRQLIAKTWLFRRSGLKEQTMKEYKYTREIYKTKYVSRMTLIGVILGAAITAIGAYVVAKL